MAMMISRVSRVNSSHPYLENDPPSSLVYHRLRISPWLRFRPAISGPLLLPRPGRTGPPCLLPPSAVVLDHCGRRSRHHHPPGHPDAAAVSCELAGQPEHQGCGFGVAGLDFAQGPGRGSSHCHRGRLDLVLALLDGDASRRGGWSAQAWPSPLQDLGPEGGVGCRYIARDQPS